MADQLITGTTLIESSSKSNADIPIGGIIEFDDTYSSIPDGFVACDGSVVNDPLSSYNGATLPNLNTNYWSCPGMAFKGGTDGTSWEFNSNPYEFRNDTGGQDIYYAKINIPHKAVITGAIVYASDTGNSWELDRVSNSNGSSYSVMATTTNGTEDTTISNATIDNQNYNYILICTIANSGHIDGARITYTPRYKFIIRIR